MSDTTALLKQLQSQLDGLNKTIQAADEAIKQQKDEVSRMHARRAKLQHQIQNLSAKGTIVISEHAILRYCQRVLGLDLDAVRAEILDDETRGLIQNLGNGTYPVGTSHRVKVRGSTVTTVLDY